MTISKRTLNKWRKEALVSYNPNRKGTKEQYFIEMVLHMTQELLDNHLLQEANKDGK